MNGKTGHLTKITNNLDANKNREYEFDALGRLTKAKGGNGGNLWTQNYSYDRYGNRTNVAATGVAADNSPIPTDGIPNLTYNSTNNRITTSGFEYDSAGNQTRALAEDGTWLKYEYDAANRLRIVKKDDGTLLQSFQYGSSNARLMDYDYILNQQKIFASNGGTTLSEYTEFAATVPTWTKSYIYLGSSQLSTITPNGSGGETTEYNHPDRLGIRTVTNQAAGTSYEQTTLPFGTALNAETTRSESKRFTSYERSVRTGLDYAVNRTYDSKLGRFTQIDPIKMRAVSLASPQTLNLYNYCGNDPINHVDPDGLFFGSLFKWISKIFKAINKILKWVVIAVAVVAVAIAIFHSGGAALGFLKVLMGIVGKLLGFEVSTTASIITNFAGEVVGATLASSISIGISGQIIAGLYGVGAVASQFTGNRRRNRDEKRRRAAIIDAVFKNTLWRLKKKPDCANYIKGITSDDPAIVLQAIYDKGNILWGGNPSSVADIAGPQGDVGTIFLNASFFDKGGDVGGWTSRSTMNTINARTMILLHELRHLHGVSHDPTNPNDPNSNLIFNQEIAKRCFGVVFQ